MKLRIRGLALFGLLMFNGCGGGTTSSSGGNSNTREIDTLEMALEDQTTDIFELTFIKQSEGRTRLFFGIDTAESTTMIDTVNKGEFSLTCTQVLYDSNNFTDYACSGIGPDGSGELENISFRMSLVSDGQYYVQARYETEPLFGDIFYDFIQTGANNITIIKKN